MLKNLAGTWDVKVISGPKWFKSFNLLKDRKIIISNYGYNVTRGISWGGFNISRENEIIILTYIKWPIVDKLTWTNETELSGKFYFKNKYIGNFKMKRKL